MFLADDHIHSNCSPDGTVSMSEMAAGAVKAGLSSICFTDHCDFLSLDGSERTLEYDWASVMAQWLEVCALYGKRLDLRLGLEFGMGHLAPQAAEKILRPSELDFVIGSVHNLTEGKGGRDFYFLPYETEVDCYEALDNYFDSMLRLAQSPYYDVLGHIIYPLRYMTGDYGNPISLGKYEEILREILHVAIDAGRGIEINTWKGQTIAPWKPILRTYKELRGEIITVGSDAHAPEPIGLGVKETYSLMADMGFRYVASYKGRKPSMIKL